MACAFGLECSAALLRCVYARGLSSGNQVAVVCRNFQGSVHIQVSVSDTKLRVMGARHVASQTFSLHTAASRPML